MERKSTVIIKFEAKQYSWILCMTLVMFYRRLSSRYQPSSGLYPPRRTFLQSSQNKEYSQTQRTVLYLARIIQQSVFFPGHPWVSMPPAWPNQQPQHWSWISCWSGSWLSVMSASKYESLYSRQGLVGKVCTDDGVAYIVKDKSFLDHRDEQRSCQWTTVVEGDFCLSLPRMFPNWLFAWCRWLRFSWKSRVLM